MKKPIIIAAVVLIALVVGVLAWKLLGAKSSVPTQPAPGVSFPVASSSGGTIVTGDGVVIRDFLHNGQTVPDPANEGNYLVAGSLNYCPADMDCTAGTSTDYNIMYDSSAGAFTIALLAEPIGKTRQEAEQFLMGDLGITQDQMCQLRAFVGTPYTVNETFSGKNLGFSFCSGAVKLP